MSRSAAPKVVPPLGLRLVLTRGSLSQPARAQQLGVHRNTYARWEREEGSIPHEALAVIAAEGWNLNWLLNGVGPERLEQLSAPARGRSQPVSPADLSIALQLANAKLAADRKAPNPDQYAVFVLTILEAVQRGLPDAEVLDFSTGQRISRAEEGMDDDGG